MPRIKAATVAAHRQAQRSAILEAACEIILREGLAGVTFARLAERTGLARPSIYEYFRTKSEMVDAIVQNEAPGWRSDVSAAMKQSISGAGTVAAFVRAILELVRDGRHEMLFALAAGDLDTAARESIMKAHEGLFALIVPTLRGMGVRDVSSCIAMIGSVVTVTVQRLREDRQRCDLIDLAVSFAAGGVTACVSAHA
jgi:AcrR family transcriptional regulator